MLEIPLLLFQNHTKNFAIEYENLKKKTENRLQDATINGNLEEVINIIDTGN